MCLIRCCTIQVEKILVVRRADCDNPTSGQKGPSNYDLAPKKASKQASFNRLKPLWSCLYILRAHEK